jgi:putative ABC transport system substrate-binding protein
MNNRRKLLIMLVAGAIVAPFDAFPQQQGKVWRVGFLSSRSRPASLVSDEMGAFLPGMRELGYVEGKNLMIEWRFAEGKYERLSSLAAELVQMKVDVIVTSGTPATSPTQKATTTIPIVMVNVGDPVTRGFVKSLAHPGGNITGLSTFSSEISAKQLEMLLSMVPKLSRVAILLNPGNTGNVAVLKDVQAVAQKIKVMILPLETRTAQEIEKAFSTMVHENVGAVIVSLDSLFVQQLSQVSELVAKHKLPSISGRKEYTETGFLMSYGPSTADLYRRGATYVDKIFKGAKPGDLPIEQPTKLELVVNMKTAKALGIKIPNSILVRADRVIE